MRRARRTPHCAGTSAASWASPSRARTPSAGWRCRRAPSRSSSASAGTDGTSRCPGTPAPSAGGTPRSSRASTARQRSPSSRARSAGCRSTSRPRGPISCSPSRWPSSQAGSRRSRTGSAPTTPPARWPTGSPPRPAGTTGWTSSSGGSPHGWTGPRPPRPRSPGRARACSASGGSLAVGALSDEIGWSRRHLAARFRAQVGVTPKALARLLRFERAVAQLAGARAGELELGRVALDCGYYDQPHFNREFRAFAGVPPTVYLARRAAPGAGISTEAMQQVTSVQDPGRAAA
ncbi:MAG: helix-turn-helix domain-containing protein [Solirubrobacteraceae bacterium]